MSDDEKLREWRGRFDPEVSPLLHGWLSELLERREREREGAALASPDLKEWYGGKTAIVVKGTIDPGVYPAPPEPGESE